MYSIGEISKIVKISIDTLRYYDEIGLLKPIHTDQYTHYRYYSAKQVNDIFLILEYKQLGFSLDEIKDLLSCDDSDKLKSAFNKRYDQLSKEAFKIESSMKLIKERLKTMEERGNFMKDNKSVLLVDDSDFLRMMLKDILEKYGYKIVGEAANGNDGVKKYLELNPHIVIMDIHMPELDGISALKNIVEHDADVKVIMCSAKSYAPKVLKSLKNGACDFVAKPFMPNIIIEALNKAISKKPEFDSLKITTLLDSCNDEKEETTLNQDDINDIIASCII